MRENQKLVKNGFPPRGKIKNQQKSTFPHGGKQEISEKQLSPARESKKMLKIILRLQATSEKTMKIVLRGIPKGRNSEKQCFGMPRRVVFCENEPSGSPEASKIRKTIFRGVPKLEKSEKRVLGASRNMKTMKKDAKSIIFRPWGGSELSYFICAVTDDTEQVLLLVSPNSRTSFADYKEILEAVNVRCLRTRVLHL